MLVLMLAVDFLNRIKVFFDIEKKVEHSCPPRRHICSRMRFK
jgi:hypothetical protein